MAVGVAMPAAENKNDIYGIIGDNIKARVIKERSGNRKRPPKVVHAIQCLLNCCGRVSSHLRLW